MTGQEAGRIGGIRNGDRLKAKTHCPRGHPYSGSNLWIDPIRGWRQCRACSRLRSYLRWKNRNG